MIAVLAPGQGAQSPGMLSPWLELPDARENIGELSEVAGLDLLRLGTTADAAEIADTAVTQPLIVALGVLVAAALDIPAGSVLAGHSIGELTAAVAAGAFTARDAVAFASRRGADMAAACALEASGMTAVLGGDAEEVSAAIEAAGLTPANRNGAGQIVAAGGLEELATLAQNPPAGVRMRPLTVAGAFHSPYMAPAEKALLDYAAGVPVQDPQPILLSNADGTAVSNGQDLIARLVAQVTRSVRWDLCQHTMRDVGVTAAIELAPAGTLTGIAKRELKGIDLVALKTPADLDAARALIARTPDHQQGEHTPEFRIVVAPAKGVFTRAEEMVEGHDVIPGLRIGTVRTNRDEFPVVAPVGGVLTEWLRHDGDIVNAGLPVARLA